MVSARIHIGTSGWNYPEKGTGWRGVFYPPKVDELEFYSRYFDTVEINSSFYGPPAAKTSEAWTKRTPAHFRFSMKLWQKFTHPKMFEEATGEKSVIGSGDFETFREGIDPIVQAGKLSCLLMQFPPSFHAKEGSLENLERYLVQFREYPLVVELRHRSWGEIADRLKETFASLNVAWAFIDEPKFSSSIRQDLVIALYSPRRSGPHAHIHRNDRDIQAELHHRTGRKRYAADESGDRRTGMSLLSMKPRSVAD